MNDVLYVIKLGSKVILESGTIFKEIAQLAQTNCKILLVCGGARAIEQRFSSMQKEVQTLTLANGDHPRYVHTEDIQDIIAAYTTLIFPAVVQGLKMSSLKVWCQCAGDNQLVLGKKGKPIKALINGKSIIVRDSMYGAFSACNRETIQALISANDIVCLSGPVFDSELGQMINIDADMLAAHLFINLDASHLRIVTGTPGVLLDTEDIKSTIVDVFEDSEVEKSISGGMRQKVRACRLAIRQGVGDVSICGPDSLLGGISTWFWRGRNVPDDMKLTNSILNIVSVTQHEEALSRYISERMSGNTDISSWIDEAGNIVCTKGMGEKKIILLGHIDTVPYVWKPDYTNEHLTGRGAVDAKSSFANFLEVLLDLHVPENCQAMVVGAVGEENSSSSGAFYVRDHYKADAVVVGEPSGTGNLTLGYFGLLKLEITSTKAQEHSAAKNAESSIENAFRLSKLIGHIVAQYDKECLSSIIDVEHTASRSTDMAKLVLSIRVSPQARQGYLEEIAALSNPCCRINVLRNTPGYKTGRANALVRAFIQSAESCNYGKMSYLMKKGTSDMNTLATGWWRNIPMVAYGPGDATLDHTDHEVIDISDIRMSRQILYQAIQRWFEND